jgi:hypothetical protein
MKNKAKDYFLGKNGEKFNCAESVSRSYSEKSNFTHKDLDSHADCGGGLAPGGYCGAFYSALYILELTGKYKRKECEAFFIGHAGALTCEEIRRLKKLSCLGCVEKAAEFLMNIDPEVKI